MYVPAAILLIWTVCLIYNRGLRAPAKVKARKKNTIAQNKALLAAYHKNLEHVRAWELTKVFLCNNVSMCI